MTGFLSLVVLRRRRSTVRQITSKQTTTHKSFVASLFECHKKKKTELHGLSFLSFPRREKKLEEKKKGGGGLARRGLYDPNASRGRMHRHSARLTHTHTDKRNSGAYSARPPFFFFFFFYLCVSISLFWRIKIRRETHPDAVSFRSIRRRRRLIKNN